LRELPAARVLAIVRAGYFRPNQMLLLLNESLAFRIPVQARHSSNRGAR
jgi:hypothetical protein